MPEGSLRPTRRLTLLLIAAVSAAVAWLVISRVYGSLPAVPVIALLTPAILAVVLAFLAWSTGQRVRHTQRAASWRPLDPLVVARFLVLAKACAVAGALGIGFWAGYLLAVVDDLDRLSVARSDAWASVLGTVLSLAVVVAALWLESACQVPPVAGDEDGGAAGSAAAG